MTRGDMRDADEKSEAVRQRIGDWSAYGVGIGALLAAVQKAGIQYRMKLNGAEHEASVIYSGEDGCALSTKPTKNADAFTALRDALYQWVKATEEEM